MFVDELRRAVEASPHADLPKVSALLWKAYAAGHVIEAEAQALAEGDRSAEGRSSHSEARTAPFRISA